MKIESVVDLNITEILKKLSTSQKGLSVKNAQEQLKKFGHNVIKRGEITWYDVLINQFKSTFVYLLIAVSLISLYLHEYSNALMILLFIIINTALGFYQEYRSNQTALLLSKVIAKTIPVLRDGEINEIETDKLVPGDIIYFTTGDIVPADSILITAENLTIDESLVTGESVAVLKNNALITEKQNEESQIFSGTNVVSGKGTAVIISTANDLKIAKIAQLAQDTKKESSFQKEINRISKFIMWLTITTLIVVLIVDILLKPEQSVTNHLIFAIVLAVGVIPEALPIVTTFSLSKGAFKLSKNKVVVKRLSAVEDLGGIEILCTDKTGTLTENKMTVSEILSDDSDFTILFANLKSNEDLKNNHLNTFDLAISDYVQANKIKALKKVKIINSYPFDPIRKRSSILAIVDNSQQIIVKGAPENILSYIKSMDVSLKKLTLNWIKQEGEKGRRVIAIAKRNFSNNEYTVADEESELELVGVIAFEDHVKKSTQATLEQARKLGVRIKILTGDAPEVSASVAMQIGLITDKKQVITGDQFNKLSQSKKIQAVESYDVFARIEPSDKHAIISLLKTKYEVGFIGDGINDAPALKAASVGLAVKEATHITRDAADIILLKKDLSVIIYGIKEGRMVFANTVKYIKSTLSSNFGNFYAIAIASLMIDYLPILPLQILLINLLSDFPAIAIATDTVDEQDLISPKKYDIKDITTSATIFGITSSVFDFILFIIFVRFSPAMLQTGWFIESVITELLFLFIIRSKKTIFRASKPSSSLIWLTVIAGLGTIIVPFTNFGHNFFSFVDLTFLQIIIILLISISYVIITEIIKKLYYSNGNKISR